jgi:hypothetical protein
MSLSVEKEVEVVKAIPAIIPLGESELDVYMLPDGEKRLGVEGIGVALGYTDRWFYNRTKRASKWLETLQAVGFNGAQKELSVIRLEARGASLAKTISMRDFVKLVAYEATANRNLQAVILLAAFAETGLDRIVDDVFAGRSIEFLLEKIVHFSKWTYEELQEVLAYNREEARSLYPWGHPAHLDSRFEPVPPSLEL